MRSALPRAVATALTAVAFLVVAAVPAFATFASSPSPPSMSIGSATLAAPTGVSAANTGCGALTSTKVKVTWTATTSAFADGYQVLRSTTNGGPYSLVGTVSGVNTTSYTDSTVAFLTTYYYVVRATKVNWTSGNSNQVSILTLTTLCA